MARHRTDLLLPLLDGNHSGRFADLAWVPPIGGGDAGRWTPGQRDRIHARLAATVQDERLTIATRVAAVQATGRISHGLDLLTTWANREETVLAEAAITAMAQAGVPAQAVAVLLDEQAASPLVSRWPRWPDAAGRSPHPSSARSWSKR